jgi:hypothetical protein
MSIEISEMGSDRGEVASVVSPAFQTVNVSGKKVMLTMPWLKHTNPMTAFSVMGLFDRRRTGRLLNYGDAMVVHSRNTCADLFLSSELDFMLSIDDDMIVPFGDSRWFNAHTGFDLSEPFSKFNAMDRLLASGKTLVGGLYWGRHRTGKCMYCEAAQNPQEAEFARKAPMDLVKPTRWVATGCMLIHRSVFLDIEKKFPRLARRADGHGGQWFSPSEHTAMEGIEELRRLLSSGTHSAEKSYAAQVMVEKIAAEARSRASLGTGEDVIFCHRAKEAGHQPFVDLGCLCGHIGSCCYGPKNTFAK